MKRLCLPLVLIFCLLLSACGGRAQAERFEQFSTELVGSTSLSFTSQLRCEYEDRSVDFILSYSEGSEGAEVKVLKPDSISGVIGHVKPGSSALEYGEIIIDTGDLDKYGLSPMTALPALAQALKTGHVESSWEEENSVVYELSCDEHLTVRVWFNALNMIPQKAELISEGQVKVFCKIENWTRE